MLRHLAVLILPLPLALAAQETIVHVAPQGKDTGVGTASQPLASLTAARDRLRKATGTRRMVVHGGTYEDVGLELTADDNGLTIAAAPGETPELVGGIPLTGWVPDGDHLMAAPLPARPDWQIRLLQVEGRSCPRARLPAEGRFTHESRFTVRWMSSTAGGWERKPTTEELTTFRYKAGDLPDGAVLANAELTIFHMWDESAAGVAARDAATRTLTLATPCGHPPGAFGVNTWVAWNLREGLTSPGQWYHDRVGQRIVYWPLPGQDVRRVRALVPTRERVISLRGTKEKPVRNVTLRGLTVTVANIPLQAAGFAADAYPGAVALSQTEACTIERLHVHDVAGHAIAVGGSADVTVTGCVVERCGAGGIYAGGQRPRILGNHIRDIGLSAPSAIGIYRGGTDGLVSHNEVHGCSYAGINYGGLRNTIEYNRVYDCMRVLHDGAGIYLFKGLQCTVRGNLVTDIVSTGGYGASGIYLDEQSEGCVVEGNVTLRVPWVSQNHMAHHNIYRNNIFIAEGDAKFTLPKSRDYTFERNLIVAGGRITIDGAGSVTTWNGNLFHSRTGAITYTPVCGYGQSKETIPAPAGMVTDDPLLVDPQSENVAFRPGSPAIALGIQPVDARKAGISR